jgi:hypothetical protein
MGYPPAWGLGDELTTPHRERPTSFEMLHREHLYLIRMKWKDSGTNSIKTRFITCTLIKYSWDYQRNGDDIIRA